MAETTFVLVRHGSCEPLGKWLAGRSPGVRLDQLGREQADALAASMADLLTTYHCARPEAIYSSPMERTLETAERISQMLDLPVRVSEGLQEIHFGEWSGKSFAQLNELSGWKEFNHFRSWNPVPGGETVLDAQHRIVKELSRLSHLHAGKTVILVTHADVIKATLTYFMGIPIDFFLRFEIFPASVNMIRVGEWGPQILCINGLASKSA
jgi:probable phosphoglycerate mutase